MPTRPTSDRSAVPRSPATPVAPPLTLADLLTTIAACGASDSETVATLVHLVNSRRVRLTGRLRNARIA